MSQVEGAPEERPDASVEITVEVEGRAEIRTRILARGDQAELIAPAELRDAIVASLRPTLGRCGALS